MIIGAGRTAKLIGNSLAICCDEFFLKADPKHKRGRKMINVLKKSLMYGAALMVLTMHTDTMARERGELIVPESDA